MRQGKTLFLASGLALLAGAAMGCDAGGQSPSYSTLSDGQRSSIRATLRHFDGSANDGLDVTQVMGTILSEGKKLVPHSVLNDDYQQSPISFQLSELFSEFDYWGDNVGSGGFIAFDETSHDSSGFESPRSVTKPWRYFTLGSAEAFSSSEDVFGAATQRYTTETSDQYNLGSDSEYHIDHVHQRKQYSQSTGGIYSGNYNEVYTYTTHPVLIQTIESGSNMSSQSVTEDVVFTGSSWEEDAGWQVTTTTATNLALDGTVTRYRPIVGEAFSNETPDTFNVFDQVNNNVRTETSNITTNDLQDANIGANGEVYEQTTTTATNNSVRRVDNVTGAVLSLQSDSHTTIRKLYQRRTGQGLDLLQSRALEDLYDHVVTERTIVQEETSYENSIVPLANCIQNNDCPNGWDCTTGHDGQLRCLPDSGSFSPCNSTELMLGTDTSGDAVCAARVARVRTTTVYRHTDNPATRNDIAAWKCTRQVERDAWAITGSTYTDEGVEWLTSYIEVDPEFSSRPYSYQASATTENIESTDLIGMDLQATTSYSSTEVNLSLDIQWGEDTLSIAGGHLTTSTSIANGIDGHTASGNADGTYSVSFNDSSATVGAEEYLDNLVP